MRISVIGSGYVGTTVAACFADAGHEVVNIDIDEDIVASINEGVAPIHEEGLDELVAEHGGKRLHATTDYAEVVDTEITFLCLPTPSREDGSVDLTTFEAGVESLGDALAGKDEHTVVTKSTVPPGTAERVVAPALGPDVHVVSNPEFLREGTAVDDLRNPDKVVVGSESAEARTKVLEAYEGVHENQPDIVETGNTEAETIKYANNSFLAAKVSLVNEIGNICKELDVDAYEVLEAVGLDDRVSSRFLRSGLGWGGSCLVGDERVVVKDDEETEHTTLAEFFEEYASEDGDALEDVSVLSLREDGTYGFEPVVAVTRREYDGDLHTVRTRMNKTVTVTHDHPMLIAKDGDMTVREARELTEGDRLPVLNEIPENPVYSFDLVEFVDGSSSFDNENVYLKPHVGLDVHKEELRKLLADYNEQFDYDKVHEFVRNGYLRLDAFLAVEDGLSLDRSDFALYTTVGGGQTYIPAVIEADEDFWRFIGYYISEGHIADDDTGHGSTTRRRVFLSFHPEDEDEYVADVESYLERLGVRYTTRQMETTKQVEVSSRVFAEFLEDIGCGTDSYTARVPDTAYDEPAENRVALLSGLFRGDGHIEYTNHSNAVVYDYGSVSEELIQGMQLLLHSLGIVPSYKTSQSKKSTRPAHFLRVSSKEQVAALKEMFLPSERDKIQRRLESYDKEIAPTGYAADGGQTTVEVREVTVENATTDVYSLEVEDSHTFVTTDGIAVHNCFPKDVDAFRAVARDEGYDSPLLNAAVEVNDLQPKRALDLLERHVDPDGARVAVLGLAFKPGTDDVRNSRAIDLAELLVERDAHVVGYDPEAAEKARAVLPDSVEIAASAQDALEGADAAVIATAWEEFENVSLDGMNEKVVIDGRRMELKDEPDVYEGLCW
jgi:UDPglucose 6-dehydrogenase